MHLVIDRLYLELIKIVRNPLQISDFVKIYIKKYVE